MRHWECWTPYSPCGEALSWHMTESEARESAVEEVLDQRKLNPQTPDLFEVSVVEVRFIRIGRWNWTGRKDVTTYRA